MQFVDGVSMNPETVGFVLGIVCVLTTPHRRERSAVWSVLLIAVSVVVVAYHYAFVTGNNTLWQSDVLFGLAAVSFLGVAITGVSRCIDFLLSRLQCRGSSTKRSGAGAFVVDTSTWATAVLALALIARGLAKGQAIPLIREDALYTGVVMIWVAMGVVGAMLVRSVIACFVAVAGEPDASAAGAE